MVGALVVAVLLHLKRLENIVKIQEGFPFVRPPSSWLEWWILWFVQGEVHGVVHRSVCPCEFRYIMHGRHMLHQCQSIRQSVGPNHRLATVVQ